MPDNVVHLNLYHDAPKCLRNLADAIEKGEDPHLLGSVTVVAGVKLLHMGETPEQYAAQQALFNLQFGVQRLMSAAVSVLDD